MSYDDLYPVVIEKDRYGGTYSKGKWIAFHLHSLPYEVSADDITCMNFWDRADERFPVGRGDTPGEALEELQLCVEEWRRRDPR